MIKVVRGDLLKASETFIVHQCNSTTTRAAHLAKSVFQAFPHADIYSSRQIVEPSGTSWGKWRTDKLGIAILTFQNIKFPKGVFYIDKEIRPVAALIAQRCPGKAGRSQDSKKHRLHWFKMALVGLSNQCKELRTKVESRNTSYYYTPPTFAFPWRIGCGAAGGDWDDYMDLLLKFAKTKEVTLYKL